MDLLKQVPPVEGRVEKGMVLYGEHCQGCHGLGGNGASAPGLHKDWHSVRPDLTIRSTIVNGIPGSAMPAWDGQFDEEQVNSLVALLLEWSQDPPLAEETSQKTESAPWFLVLLAVLCLPVGWFWFRRVG
jgi:mono/diheme cytochrome c family protein